MRRPPVRAMRSSKPRAPFDVDVLGAERERLARGSACAPLPIPLKPPPSHAGRQVTMTGRRRPASAPATSGSLTVSSRSSTRSASATASRCRRSSAVVGGGHGDAEEWCRSQITKKKPLQPVAEEAWKSRSRGGRSGQGGCLFSRCSNTTTTPTRHGRAAMATRRSVKALRPSQERRTIANAGDRCQHDRPFLLDQ